MQGKEHKNVIFSENFLIIVGGGHVDVALLKTLYAEGAMVIGADGGADICAGAGIVPDAIIGDLDSLADSFRWGKKTKIIEIKEQDTTDFEKCLYSSEAPITICLGVTGKRLDHTLAALDVLARHAARRHMAIVSETDLVLAVRGKFAFEIEKGARVSVHPVTPITFATSVGLEFPLQGVELAPGLRTGTSNRALSGVFSIVPKGDENTPYLVIIDKSYLQTWVEVSTA